MRQLQASPVIPLVTIPLFLVSAAAPLVRFRRASGGQRQQLKWFAYAVGLLVGLLILGQAIMVTVLTVSSKHQQSVPVLVDDHACVRSLRRSLHR